MFNSFNEKVRKQLCDKYSDDIFSYNYIPFLKDIESFKYNSYDDYRTLISILYPVFYLLNLEKYKDYDLLEEPERTGIYEPELLDSFESIDDVLYYIEEDIDMLMEIIYSNCVFECKSELEKRKFCLESEKYDRYLFDISSFWFIDKIAYCKNITKEDILQKFIYKTLNRDINFIPNGAVFSYDIDNICIYLETLSLIDYENYFAVFESMFNDSYKYFRYQFDTQKMPFYLLEEDLDKFKEPCEIIAQKALKNIYLMGDILVGFWKFSNCSEEQKKLINAHFNKKNKVKKID